MTLTVRLATLSASLSMYESAAPDTDVARNLQPSADSIRSARDDLNRSVAEKQEELERLQKELDEAKDDAASAWGVFKSFFGDDSGAADMSAALERKEFGAGVQRYAHATEETYKKRIEEIEQAKEQRGDSPSTLFGSIFGGHMVGTLVGSAIAGPEAERGAKAKPQQPIALASADSISWRDALRKDPD
jgi:DNA repair exonuclease SbcCD ATPase subunit